MNTFKKFSVWFSLTLLTGLSIAYIVRAQRTTWINLYNQIPTIEQMYNVIFLLLSMAGLVVITIVFLYFLYETVKLIAN